MGAIKNEVTDRSASDFTVTMRNIRLVGASRRKYYAVILNCHGQVITEGEYRDTQTEAERDMIVFFRNLP